MKREDTKKYIGVLHRNALSELPLQVKSGKLHKDLARKYVLALALAFAVLDTMTDDEYEDILNRIEIKGPEYEQGSLF